MDLGSLAALISSLQSAGDITKAMIELRDAQAIQTKAFELTRELLSAQSNALTAQQSQAELLARVRQLEEQLQNIDEWKGERLRYQLTDFGCQTFAYVLKEDMANGEPRHRLCVKCYNVGRKGILGHQFYLENGRERVECLGCGQELTLGCSGGRLQTHALTW